MKTNYNHDKVENIIKSLNHDDLNWLYRCCSIIIFSMEIQNIDKINEFFKKKRCKLKKIKRSKFDKYFPPVPKIQFADSKWFIRTVFDEHQKRGNIVSGRHYESIKNNKS